MNRVSTKRRSLLKKTINKKPWWWPTPDDLLDPIYDSAVASLIQAEDEVILKALSSSV